MTLASKELLRRQQELAEKAGKRMLDMLIGYEPARELSVGDVKFIAEWARTVAFDAMRECDQ